MSRETDTPSSGPNGHGGAAYPSGTPPYGIPAIPDEGAGRPAARPEDRKTETTLTTRIRINIPGSRPIPPVVVRKPVADAEDKGTADAEAPAPSPAAPEDAEEPPAEPAPSPRPAPQPAEDKPTSDWFAPRKPATGKGGPAGVPGNGPNVPGGSGPAAAGPTAAGSAPSGAPGSGAAGGARPGAGRPGGVVGSMGAPGGSRPGGTNGAAPGPRPGGTNGSGITGATGGPVAPGHGGGTGSFDVTEALAGGPAGGGTRPGTAGGGEPRRDDPYVTEGGPGDRNGQPGHGGPGHPAGRSGPGQGRPAGPQGPAGPTTGPVTGNGRMTPPGAAPGNGPMTPPGAAPGGPGGPGTAFDEPGGAGGPGGAFSDDTAILTPQQPAPGPGTPGYGARHDNVSGHTVTSGIPVVPPGTAFGAGPGSDGPLTHTPPKLPQPASPPPAGSSKPAKKKGRRKLPLLVGAVVFLGGAVYGAGLLMNHSDVPKGTTVLGVDIGGTTRDEAVNKLDEALDDRLNKPLKLSVGGRTVALEPDNAGLQFDTDATVGTAARSDYNPVSVIGSLFGNHRVVDPVMPVDEEKLHAALQDAAGGAGSMVEGSIRFASGKAVPVYPRAGQGIDVAEATDVVAEAYRTQVETGAAAVVNVPTAPRQPKVSKAEVDRMMKEFAEPAMSGLVTVRTDAAHSIPFGPVSLPKILGVKAVGGKLVETYDLEALRKAYGSTFEGVQIEGATGKRDVRPEDVVSALREALRGKTPAERVGVIETNPN